MQKMAALANWPWGFLENYKYYLYVPLIIKASHFKFSAADQDADDWFLHILVICGLRYFMHSVWHFFSRAIFLNKRWKIQSIDAEFDQVDREFHWDNYIIFQAWSATAVHVLFPSLSNIPFWNYRGIVLLVVLHMGPTEFLYYHIHRAFHKGSLFDKYHSLHHASIRLEVSTSGTTTFLEGLVTLLLMFIPILGVILLGQASIGMFYAYFLGYDFIKNMAHSNIEVVPLCLFKAFPIMKYLIITPTYHSIHHRDMRSNYCLFMPLYDYMGGTLDETGFEIHAKLCMQGRPGMVPDCVFLCHGVDFLSMFHVGYVGRTFSSIPYQGGLFTWIFWPLTWIFLPILMNAKSTYVNCSYVLNNVVQQTWIVPRLGFQYFFPNSFSGINAIIEKAILDADKLGVKVITLGGLNKNEAMNQGGSIFVKKHGDLKVRVCHGNTLTTAIILQELPSTVNKVFLTGATSKIGKAIALYLSRKNVHVLMLTTSKERFDAIVKEAPEESRKYLTQVTEYQSGKNCKTWIAGKWAGYYDQKWAPSGTHFHQFTVPNLYPFRRDCTYGALAGLRVPDSVRGMSTCELSMPRRAIHACHAGGLLHTLEGWTHHEIGPINVDMIDVVWEKALRHGFTPIDISRNSNSTILS